MSGDSMTPTPRTKLEPDQSLFWTPQRLDTLASLPCWDIVLTLLDEETRSTAEIALITGRSPGALHAPLQRLEKAGIISSHERTPEGKGRPAREFTIVPGAQEKPCGSGREYEKAVHKATAAGLRLVMRNSGLLAEENIKASKTGANTRTSSRWIQFSTLDKADLKWVEDRLDEIMQRLAQKRSNPQGERYRAAFMLIPDDFHE